MLYIHLHIKFIFILIQLNNGVPILNFYNDKNDTELLELKEYLLLANKSKDIREFN